MATTFGIEEEFLLLDPTTLTPVERAAEAVAEVDDGRDDGTVAREYLSCQIEYATPVCTGAAEAHEALRGFRHRLGRWAADAGVVAAGTGTPLGRRPSSTVSPGERYDHIAAEVAGITAEHQVCGLHVHVGVERDAGVHASNVLRGWLPVLLALSGNSPFWDGQDTGFDGWRAIHFRRWTTYGIPPVFRDVDDYDATVAALVGLGATSDTRSLNWNMRLSTLFPTLEVRVCDAQLDAASSVALAVVVRALVDSARDSRTSASEDRAPWDAGLWHAARHGLDSGLLHPDTGRLAPVAEVLTALHDRIAPHLNGDDEIRAVARLLGPRRTGAARQREAHRAGLPALADLFRECLVD
ncbi:carboxylate-amine ligase [Microbacterium xylanilyticum]